MDRDHPHLLQGPSLEPLWSLLAALIRDDLCRLPASSVRLFAAIVSFKLEAVNIIHF